MIARLAAAALAAIALVGAAHAQAPARPTAAAAAGQITTKTLDPGKIFQYLNLFYRIPAQDRSLFELGYYVRSNRPLGSVRVWDALGEYPLAADGRFGRLPTAEQLRRKTPINVRGPDGTSFEIDLELESRVAPETSMDAAALKASVDQANRGIKGAAGMIRFAVPTMGRLVFKGAGSGQVVLADGRRVALPIAGGAPAFDVGAFPTARTVTLARTPSRIFIQPTPKPRKR